jgi:malonyl-CoA O-methyltransferase
MAEAYLPDARALARVLDRMARGPSGPWLHREIAHRMAQRLPAILRTPSTVIDWWGHLGASGDALAAAYPKARRIVVEPTAVLAQRSAEAARTPWWSARRWTAPQVEVRADDALTPASGELLWANMMLHAVSDPPAVMARWRRALAVDGFLMFSCFGPDTLAELRELYRELQWPAPARTFTDMHDIGDQLVHAGFADPVMDQEHLVLTWESADAMLSELRTLGGNTGVARERGLRTPRWRQRLVRALQERLGGPDGRLRLSFEIVYGHAFNPPPRAQVAARTEVSLDAMRAMVRTRRSDAG